MAQRRTTAVTAQYARLFGTYNIYIYYKGFALAVFATANERYAPTTWLRISMTALTNDTRRGLRCWALGVRGLRGDIGGT